MSDSDLRPPVHIINVPPIPNLPRMPFVSIDIEGIGKFNKTKIDDYLLEWVWNDDKNKKMQKKRKMNSSKPSWKNFSERNLLLLNNVPLSFDRYCTNGIRWAATFSKGFGQVYIYIGLCKKGDWIPSKSDVAKELKHDFAVSKLLWLANALKFLMGKSRSTIKIWDDRINDSGIVLQKPSFTFLGSFSQPNVFAALVPFLNSLANDSFTSSNDLMKIGANLLKNLPIAFFFFLIIGTINWMTSRSKTYWVLKTD